MSAITADQSLPLAPEAAEQLSIGRSLALHLLPGVLILALFVLTAPAALRAGIPPLVPVFASATFGLAFQVWHLFHEGKKRNGKWSLAGIVLYRQPMPVRHYLIFVPLSLALMILLGCHCGSNRVE